MSRTIWRYVLAVGDGMRVPDGPVLRAEAINDGGSVEMWIEVKPSVSSFSQELVIFGTGHDIPPEWHHKASTARSPLGLVRHVYGKRL